MDSNGGLWSSLRNIMALFRPAQETYITIWEAEELLGISEAEMQSLIAEGNLPCIERDGVPLMKEQDVDNLIKHRHMTA